VGSVKADDLRTDVFNRIPTLDISFKKTTVELQSHYKFNSKYTKQVNKIDKIISWVFQTLNVNIKQEDDLSYKR
jgi:hypothetical protein